MARFTVGKGLDEYLAQLGNLEQRARPVIGLAVYEGAKVVADAVRKEIEGLPVESTNSKGSGRRNLLPVEKEGLLEGLGVAKMKNENGFWNVKVGMDGYNADVTKKWPYGKPNAMIARSLEKGTSFLVRNAFVSRAVRKARRQAEGAMRDEVDKQIVKIVTK